MIRGSSLFRSVLVGTLVFPLMAVAFADEKSDAKTTDVKIQDITLKVPGDWKEEAPSNKLRLAQFQIAPVEGDKEGAELVVSSFGGDGGGVDPNLKRWIGEFDANGRKVKVTKGQSTQGAYYLCDLTGTYNKRLGPFAGKATPIPGSRALEVILLVPDANIYFLKLTGPEKTVTAAAEKLRTSFGGNSEKETEYSLK